MSGPLRITDPLRIREISLAGFGVYDRPVRFRFPQGGGILLGPNESGKSTLLHGLAAVLFGLPATTQAARGGTARFRSFTRPKEFWGEARWEKDGKSYRLHRRFDDHHVRLTVEEGKGPRVLFDGDHNPLATSSSGTSFLRHLHDCFGLTDQDLFEQTFCLTQPLPDERAIGADLQHLLSGSRAGRVDDVLGSLFDEVRRITRLTAELKVARPRTRPTNQREDGRLQDLEKELEEARGQREACKALLEKLNGQNRELEEIQGRTAELKEVALQRQKRLDSLDQWLRWNEERRRQADALERAGDALKQLDSVEEKRREIAPLLAGRFARFHEAPPDLAALCERAVEVEAARAQAAQEALQVAEERASLEREISALEESLAREFRDVRGRPDLRAVREHLAAATRRCEQRRARLLEEEREAAELRESLRESAAWEGVSVEALRARASALVADQRRREAIDARLAAIEAQSESHAFLAGARLEALKAKIETEERLKAVALRLRELEAERLERERAAAVTVAETPARGPILRWIAWLVPPALVPLLRFVAGFNWGVSVAAAAVAFAVLFAVDRVMRARRKANAPGSAASQGPPDAVASPGSPESPAGAPADLESVRAEQERLRADLRRLTEDLGPYAGTTGAELARFEERWRILDEERERLTQERGAMAARTADTSGFERLPAPLLTATEGTAGSGTNGPGEGRPDGGGRNMSDDRDLIRRLAALTDPDWNRFARAAEARAREVDRLRAIEADLDRLRSEESADDEAPRLAAQLAPFSLETPPETLEDLTARCREAELRLHSLREQFAALPEELARAAGEAESAAAWTDLRRAWPQGELPPDPDPDLLRAAREEEREARPLWLKAAELEEATRIILETARAGSRDEIERRRTEANAALGALLLNLEALEREDILLSQSRDEKDPIARAQRLKDRASAWRAEVAAAQDELRSCGERESALLRALASLEGSAAPNLARLSIRIGRMETERETLLRDRDALALAWQWVREAADEFQSEYRGELESRITEHFRALTGVADRRASLDEAFGLSVIGSRGEKITIEQLSQGARDQLSLSLRLAVADLLSDAVALPLFFDDPFVHYDAERLEHLRGTLSALARERQWVLLTHREEMAGWGEPVERESVEMEAGPTAAPKDRGTEMRPAPA